MKLTDLDARFIRISDEDRAPWRDGSWFVVEEIAQADGVMFLCPTCFAAKGGPIGTHSILCWRPIVPGHIDPKPGRWEFQGSCIADLTLVAGSSSVLLTSGCRAHFFVRGGEIVPC